MCISSEESLPNEERMESDIDTLTAQSEETQKEAKDHIRKYKVQRELKNSIQSIARDDVVRKVPFKQRTHCLTIDMGQNLGLPNMEAEQVGDTYYFTPLTVFVFGVNDDSRPDGTSDQMNAYIWTEGDGKRGANNIASCLLKDYRARGFLSDGKNEGSLNIIADNCGGQNKNEDVIRFHMWLVEASWFSEINIIFLVKGHTKNACDRMFNLLKHEYHNLNVESFSQLKTCLNKSLFVNVEEVGRHEFFDFSSTLNKYYRSLKSGETNRTHIFTIKESVCSTWLLKKDDADAPERIDKLLPTRRNKKALSLEPQERKIAIQNLLSDLTMLPAPGIPPIKQVELYKKWRKVISDEYKDITCPRPPEEVIQQVQNDKKAKRKK